jgi:hypothetical protein
LELKELIASADNSESDESDASFKYYASYSEESRCSTKPATSFESWEDSFATLEDCCKIAFSWDVEACMDSYLAELPSELVKLIASTELSESQYESTPSNSGIMYFASYTEGSLCSTKSAASFESWEESFSSLEECCEMAFSWDMNCLSR